jgi:hypothetical protein
VARLAVAAFYVGLAVTLGVLYSWIWVVVILLVGLVPGLALALGADKGGDFVSEMSRDVYDRRYGGRR